MDCTRWPASTCSSRVYPKSGAADRTPQSLLFTALNETFQRELNYREWIKNQFANQSFITSLRPLWVSPRWRWPRQSMSPWDRWRPSTGDPNMRKRWKVVICRNFYKIMFKRNKVSIRKTYFLQQSSCKLKWTSSALDRGQTKPSYYATINRAATNQVTFIYSCLKVKRFH